VHFNALYFHNKREEQLWLNQHSVVIEVNARRAWSGKENSWGPTSNKVACNYRSSALLSPNERNKTQSSDAIPKWKTGLPVNKYQKGHAKLQNTTTILRPFFWDHLGAGARREILDFMVQGKINRGRHRDHPARRHSIQTNQCPRTPSPIFYRPDALPAAQPTVSKHWRQKLQNNTQKISTKTFFTSKPFQQQNYAGLSSHRPDLLC